MHRMTNKGLALLGKQQVGTAQPNITRVVAGAGYVEPELLDQQTEVSEPITEMEIGEKELVDGKVARLPVQLSNLHLTETALIRQIGVYSLDPDEGEILYQIVQYDHPVPLPAYATNNGGVILFDPELDILFANGELADTPLTPSFLVTTEKLRDLLSGHDTSIGSHPDLRAELSGKANIKAPEKHIMQLVEGTHPSQTVVYFKTQEDVVTVGGEVSFYPVDLKAYSEYTFGVLPVGFRPAYELTRGLVIRTTESFKFVSGKLEIGTDGVIKGYTPNTVDGNYHNFIFEATFLAQ